MHAVLVKLQKRNELTHLHFASLGWNNLLVIGSNLAWRHLVQALLDDAQTLAHFLHAHQIAIVRIAIGTDGHVEFDLIVGVVRLRLSQVPLDARTSEHDTAETEIQSVLGRDNANANGTLTPETIGSKQVFYLVQALSELLDELINVVHETDW